MKRAGLFSTFLLVIIVLTLLNVNGALAALCADPSQTIISLYQQENSHESVFNSTFSDPNANYSICYNQIFGTSYAGSNPFLCTGTNKILNLYYSSNSHVSVPGTSGYNISICYGNLVCNVESGSCNAAIGEHQIASIYSLTNSHIAADNSYPYKVCCQQVSANQTGIYSISWRDANENSITNASLTDNVQMFVSIINPTSGQTVNFSTYSVGNNAFLNSFVENVGSGSIVNVIHLGILNNLVAGKNAGDSVYFNATYYNANGSKINQMQSSNLLITNQTQNFNVCANGGLLWYDSNGASHNTSVSQLGNWCLNPSGTTPDYLRAVGAPLNNCCALGTYCSNSSSSNGYYGCLSCPTTYTDPADSQVKNILRCQDYNNLNVDNQTKQQLCRSDCAGAASTTEQMSEIPSSVQPGSITCEWSNSAGCIVQYVNVNPGHVPTNFGCANTYAGESGACTDANSYKVINWIGNLTLINGTNLQILPDPTNLCPDGQTTVPCSRAVVALPFFGNVQIVLVIILVAIIYVIIFRTNLFSGKKHRRKN